MSNIEVKGGMTEKWRAVHTVRAGLCPWRLFQVCGGDHMESPVREKGEGKREKIQRKNQKWISAFAGMTEGD